MIIIRLIKNNKSKRIIMCWKQLYRKQLIQNYYALRLLHRKNAQPFNLELPVKLESKQELLDFSKKINTHITFPEFHIYS